MPAQHNCFTTILPDLPRGYQLDIKQPLQLSPLPGQHVEPIPVCYNCWLHAFATYDVNDMNTLSAWLSVNEEEWGVLRGLQNAFPHVNAVSHVLYDFLYPLHVRERRTALSVLRYDAVKPKGANGYKLTYRVKYRLASGEEPEKPISLSESELRQYPGGLDAVLRFWYGEGTHSLELAFIRGLLAQDPATNMMLWGLLPVAEACCIFMLYNNHELGNWVPGMTL
jgi:hypothetical protein